MHLEIRGRDGVQTSNAATGYKKSRALARPFAPIAPSARRETLTPIP